MVGIHLSWQFGSTGYRRMAVYFKDEEVKGLDAELVAMLDMARKIAGVPFVITSGLRSCAANTAALGVENSAHLSGKAVDIAILDGNARFHIVKGLIGAGFVRIGVYTAHAHADVDASKPQDVCWIGVSH
jgi:zinc D-Ala-D-Ala carboxypeptidase